MYSEQPSHPQKELPSQPDAELYQALRSGQANVLGILYDRHAGLVYGVSLKILGNSQEAEDLTQDIFLTIAKGCSYDSSRGSLRTFLAVLTRSRAIDRIRSRQAALQTLGKWKLNKPPETDANSPFEYVVQEDQSQEVQAALSQLSDVQQQILKLSYYDGLSQSEIAKRLQIPLGTVKARARRGLLNLRQTLTDFIDSQ